MFGAAMADKFALSYLFLVVAAVYALGCLLTSQTFAIKALSRSVLYLPGGHQTRIFIRWKWSITFTLLMIIPFLVAWCWVAHLEYQKELESLAGRLVSANEPDGFASNTLRVAGSRPTSVFLY